MKLLRRRERIQAIVTPDIAAEVALGIDKRFLGDIDPEFQIAQRVTCH